MSALDKAELEVELELEVEASSGAAALAEAAGEGFETVLAVRLICFRRTDIRRSCSEKQVAPSSPSDGLSSTGLTGSDLIHLPKARFSAWSSSPSKNSSLNLFGLPVSSDWDPVVTT